MTHRRLLPNQQHLPPARRRRRPNRGREPPPTQRAGDQGKAPRAGPLAQLRGLVQILGPTTLLTALLVYFGYVGTTARFEYFGVYLSMVDLSNQELLLSGLEVVYLPALVVSVGVLAAVGVHAAVSWLLTAQAPELGWSAAGLAAVVGLLLVGRALVGILVPGVVATETPPGQTPLALALGPALVAYSMWIAARLRLTRAPASTRSGTFARWYATPAVQLMRRTGVAMVLAIFVVGMFWASNSFALAFGAGRAYQDALRFRDKPEVILDMRGRLQRPPPGVTEIALGRADGDGFRYRYRNLRLLIESEGRLFLIPAQWTRAGRTIIVPYNNEVRIQLVPAPAIYEAPS